MIGLGLWQLEMQQEHGMTSPSSRRSHLAALLQRLFPSICAIFVISNLLRQNISSSVRVCNDIAQLGICDKMPIDENVLVRLGRISRKTEKSPNVYALSGRPERL